MIATQSWINKCSSSFRSVCGTFGHRSSYLLACEQLSDFWCILKAQFGVIDEFQGIIGVQIT